jgi:hypothetical protein
VTRSESSTAILELLAAVDAERAERAGDIALAARVQALKRYQQRRFESTYADLLAHPRYGGASHFFLDELYGPADFTQRDAQFARVVPGLVRLFPNELIGTVQALAALHALSERFDTAMGRALESDEIQARDYVRAWQRCDQAAERERQIVLLLKVGGSLDELTRSAMLRHSLRLMRAPARAAGLAALQAFLENGFDTFRAMRGAQEFLALIGERERALAAWLFSVDASQVQRLAGC